MRALLKGGAGQLPALDQRFWMLAAVGIGLLMSVLLLLDKPAIYLVAIPGIAVAFLVLRQPHIGTYLLAVALPLDVAGNLSSVTGTFNISIAWICTLLTLLAWIVNVAVQRCAPLLPIEAKTLLIYLAIGLVSLPTALEFDRGVEEIVRVVQTILFFVMILNLLKTREQVILAITLLVTASVLSFGYALAQKFILPANIIAERGLDLLKPGAVTYGIEMGKVDTQGHEAVARVTGTTVHAGVLALNCAYMLPFIIVFMRLKSEPVSQTLGWTAVLLTLAAFGTTLARSGFLTLAFTLLMLVWMRILKVTGLRLGAIMLLIVLGLPFLPDGFIERVLLPSSYMTANSDSLSGRLEMWAASLQAIFDNPLTGFGIGNEHGIFDYWRPELRDQLGTVMNTPLQIAMEVGIFGLVTFTAFVYLMFMRVIRGRRNFRVLGDETMITLGTGMLVLLMALVVSWMSVEFLRAGFKNVWFLLACMVAYHEISGAALAAADKTETAAPSRSGPRNERRAVHV